jgi:transmembrane sensor
MTAQGTDSPGKTNADITDRAAAFYERRRFGEWTENDQAELDAWFAESIFHEVAFLRLKGAVVRTETLVSLRPFRQVPKSGWRARLPRGLFVPLLAAASVAIIAMLGMLLANYLLQPGDRTYATDIGGRTLLSFSDRTQIELNTSSLIRYRMLTTERTVWLLKGEAWFHVAHNAANPFTVIVGTHRVTDLGTEFMVRRDPGEMKVTLLNGRATLSTDGAQAATLRPGDEAVATPASLTVTRKTAQELADELAWRRGTLVFRHTPLADVVREFNRYNTTKLVIADPAIARKTIVADAQADDVESFLRFAEDVLKLRVEREGGVVLLSAGKRSKQ